MLDFWLWGNGNHDFLSVRSSIQCPTPRTHVQTTNGECVSVDWAGIVDVSPSIHLTNYLLIPSLSHNYYQLVNWLRSLIVLFFWLSIVVLCRMFRLGQSLDVVLKGEVSTIWRTPLNKIKLCLLVGPRLINSRHGTDA